MQNTIILVPSELELEHLKKCLPTAPLQLCGVGQVECAATVAQLCSEQPPEHLILVGIAGAMPQSNLKLCEVVGVTSERTADLGAWRGERFQPLFQRVYSGAKSIEGISNVASRTVNCAGLPSLSGDEAIENMEGAGFMAVCQKLGVQYSQIRSISNYVGDSPDKWHIAEALDALADFLNDYLKL